MSEQIVARSFAELSAFLHLTESAVFDTAEDVPDLDAGTTAALLAMIPPDDPDRHLPEDSDATGVPIDPNETEGASLPVDLAALLTTIEEASLDLEAATRADAAARELARCLLARHDELCAAIAQTQQAHEQLSRLLADASALRAGGFTDAARQTGERIGGGLARADEAASVSLAKLTTEAAAIAAAPDVQRLLAERRNEEEAQRSRVATQLATRRLAAALARVREALALGGIAEASALLGEVEVEHAGHPEVLAIREELAGRRRRETIAAAESALRFARREVVADAWVALNRLTELDPSLLPEPLARQVFGEWAKGCSRHCRDHGLVDARRYAPDPGRGVVIARRTVESPHEVVSELGTGEGLKVGQVVPAWLVRRSRPLR